MSAIERCRTVALGGHVARCENDACGYTVISYNSCRNRHCPKCQGAAARKWLAEREAELLPVGYFHVVYTLPARLRDMAYQNKRVVYDLLMKAAAETTLTIATDPKRLGAKIGITAVLHTWGSALTHHPHVHMIVPAAACRRMDRDGSRADRASLRVWRCSRGCSAAACWRCWRKRTPKAGCTSTAITPHSPTDGPSSASSLRCVGSSGSSTAKSRWPVLAKCCAICRATRIASPSPTAGWSPPTTAPSRSAGRTIASLGPSVGRR